MSTATVAVALLGAMLAGVFAGNGAAAVPTCLGEPATIVGTTGDDTLTGTSGKDVIAAHGGKDNITARGGDDVICGGGDNDGINAGDGNDRIAGDDGYDLIVAGSGNDVVYGGPGTDALYGGPGVDELHGGSDSDYVVGGPDGDALFGDDANDVLLGQGGSDRVDGGAGGSDACKGETRTGCERSPSVPCPPAFAAELGVRDPSRMVVANACYAVTGPVLNDPVLYDDGDMTFNLVGDATGEQFHVEFVPRDSGHFAVPVKGSRVSLVGVRAADNHGRLEIHPAFQEDYRGVRYRSGPDYAGNPDRGYPTPCWRDDASPCTSVGWNAAGGTLTATAVADAYVASDAPSSNFGAATQLKVDGSPTLRSYLRFDVKLPTGATVTRVRLRVFTTTSSTSTGFVVNAVAGNSWAENSIAYATAPPLGAQLGTSGGWSTTGYRTVTLSTGAVVSGANSYALSTTSTSSKWFDSREGANPPQLIVDYTL